MGKLVDLTGQKFGEWTVLEYVGNRKWHCKCSCGNEKDVSSYELRIGATKSCGHSTRTMESLIGKIFGQLEVIDYAGDYKWKCKCECGNEHVVNGSSLRSGATKSCGHATTGFKDLTGKHFGEWTVLEYAGGQLWNCECSCGEKRLVKGYLLCSGQSKSCGHSTNKFKDLTGETFGRLTVQKYMGYQKWLCLCECNNEVVVRTQDLKSGATKSCGCLRNEHKENWVGLKFGEWEVIDNYVGRERLCRCSCGKIRSVSSYALKSGKSKSCGHIEPPNFIDITGEKFGELTAKSYVADGKWLCECSCGSEIIIKSRSLRDGRTRSCGCKALEFTKLTLCERYNEVSARKRNNPREAWQIEVLDSRENLAAYIARLAIEVGHKPNIREISDRLNINVANVGKYINKFGLTDNIHKNINHLENDLYDFILSISGGQFEVIKNDRSVLGGYELDIYIPSKSLAFEFNGSYWHSSIYKDKHYHSRKTDLCDSLGIRLIHIFEYEWLDENNKSKLFDYIESLINDSRTSVYARDCDIREVDTLEAKRFEEEYHFQGYARSEINLGLYLNEKLVSLMTFGKPRFSSEYEFELIRYVNASNLRVIGGASKLFTKFVNEHSPKSVISYCDRSKFNGNVYTNLGFIKVGITEPNYKWVNSKGDVISRYMTTKQRLIDLGLGNSESTEHEIMEDLGYYRIYDSGNIKYIWGMMF